MLHSGKTDKVPVAVYSHTHTHSLSPLGLCAYLLLLFAFCTYLTYGCLVQAFFKVLSSLLLVQALFKVPSSLLPSYIPCPLSIVSEAVFFHACIIACTGKNWLPRGTQSESPCTILLGYLEWV